MPGPMIHGTLKQLQKAEVLSIDLYLENLGVPRKEAAGRALRCNLFWEGSKKDLRYNHSRCLQQKIVF